MSENGKLNVAGRLVELARERGDDIALAETIAKRTPDEKRRYRTITFRELDRNSDKIAKALIDSGVKPGMRLVLMVRPGIDFTTLVFSLYKSGAVMVMIDPGMGMKQMIRCLSEVDADGFAAIPIVHAARLWYRSSFPKAKYNLTLGRRYLWGGLSYEKILREEHPGTVLADTFADDPAAIIFTSGSTGIAKGVEFTHRIFETQVIEVAKRYGIQAGECDLSCFPFFGLFNAAMGVTAVIPEMNAARPADVDPLNILEAVRDWNIVQSFGSPALWHRVSDYCIEKDIRMETLKRVMIAGAPIYPSLLAKVKRCINPEGDVFTPYGATESLPAASIGAKEVLLETFERTESGAGICVGTRFGGIEWKVIPITDEPIPKFENAGDVQPGEIGELALTGPQVTKRYVTRTEANALAKMTDSDGRIWHRIGDVGYLDEKDRFWFCGRKSHRVVCERLSKTFFTIPCEAVFNAHEKVYRSALASRFGEPVMFIEPYANSFPETEPEKRKLLEELESLGRSNPLTKDITEIRLMRAFPVDVRHNAKINRERLSELLEKKENSAVK